MRHLMLPMWTVLVALGCRGGEEKHTGATSADEYAGDIIDAHGHVMPSWNDNVVPMVVSQGGLSGFVVLGLDNELTLQGQDSSTYANCVFFQVADGEDDPEATLDDIHTALLNGARCIGEVSIRHFASGPSATAKEHDATSDFLMDVYQLARAELGVPITVHFDYTAEHIDNFESALSQSRTADGDTQFIWAHAGDAPAHVVSSLLEDHSNLAIDLSSRNSLDSFSDRLVSVEEQRLDDGDMVLKEEWKTLMETHADRVMVGTDVGPGSRHMDAAEIVGYYRTLLGQLSPEAAVQIAQTNAQALYGL